jgi:hypothetical protein
MNTISKNCQSFVFDETRTLTFWTKDTQISNEIKCIVGTIGENKEVTFNSNTPVIALTSAINNGSFLLDKNKKFIFKKISNDQFIIATWVSNSIYYRKGTLNGSTLTFDNQAVIDRESEGVYGQTINVVVKDSKAYIFYISNYLYMFDTQTESETQLSASPVSYINLDVSLFGNKIVFVTYEIISQYKLYPVILLGTYANNTFTIDSQTSMPHIVINAVITTIQNQAVTLPITNIFFTEENKFFLVSALKENVNVVPA